MKVQNALPVLLVLLAPSYSSAITPGEPCNPPAAPGATLPGDAAVRAISPLTANQLFDQLSQSGESDWKYKLPTPFGSQPPEVQTALRAILPLDAVGTVYTQTGPLRATANFLGKKNGVYLFSIAAHVDQHNPLKLQFGQLSGKPFDVPLATWTPTGGQARASLVSEMSPDTAILAAAPNLDPAIAARLDEIAATPPGVVRLSLAKTADLMKAYPDTQFFVPGRSSYAVYQSETSDQSLKGLWSSKTQGLWTTAASEAANPLNQSSNNVGDILTVAPTRILAGGYQGPLRDPDGLPLTVNGKVVGGNGQGPFVPSDPSWKPTSIGLDFHIIGRNSGAGVIGVTPVGPLMTASGWTEGVPENMTKFLGAVEKEPKRVLGQVGVQTNPNNTNQKGLVLTQTAPASYASATSELDGALANPNADLPTQYQAALKQLREQSFRLP